MFETITPANWTMFAMRHYDNPQADGEEEFYEDIKRFKYLKRLFKKYYDTGNLKERLILNHIIILTNVFGVDASSTLLLYKIDQEYWPALKSFMKKLNMIYETDMREVPMGYPGMEQVRQNLNEGQAIDLFVAYRFLRILTTPWEDQEAFKLGIIDQNGRLLKKANELKTPEEKKSFTLLHRLIFNLKRILHKIPGVRTKIGTYATALFLLKQHFADQVEEEDTIEKAFKGWMIDNGYVTEEELEEEVSGEESKILPKGTYRLTQDVFAGNTGEIRGKKGDIIVAFAETPPTGEVIGQNIFKVVHQKSKEEIFVALEDLKEK